MINHLRDDAINRLLHDAEHASAGASFARSLKDEASATRLEQKAARLRSEAEQLDPDHAAPAWQEAERELPPF